MTMIIDGSLGVTFPNSTTQAQARPDSPQSMVQVSGANGCGSTNTFVRRYTTVVVNQGTDITYADSATLGGTFTINTSGVYAVSYSDTLSGGTMQFGVTLNDSQVTTSITSATNYSQILSLTGNSGASVEAGAAWIGYLASGSVLRIKTNTASAAGNLYTTATVARVA